VAYCLSARSALPCTLCSRRYRGSRSAGGVAETAQVDAMDEWAVDEHAVAASAGGIDVSFILLKAEDFRHLLEEIGVVVHPLGSLP